MRGGGEARVPHRGEPDHVPWASAQILPFFVCLFNIHVSPCWF